MIFILHYLLFNAGLSAVLILMTLYLQTYSDASLTEIGTLLMILPFISIVMKPLFCALADRHSAHKLYLIASLAIMALGYGSLVIAPFFPDFIENHGRIVWYCDILGIIVGFSAFGVAWSLGDALAVNAARIKGVPWGSYRVWATVSWGFFGFIVGQINETPLLPKYVPAFLVLAASCSLEIILLAIWPARRFIMVADDPPAVDPCSDSVNDLKSTQMTGAGDSGMIHKEFGSLAGTLNGSARLNPRLMGAMANMIVGEVGESLRSTLGRTSGARSKRHGLSEILDQHKHLNSVAQEQLNRGDSVMSSLASTPIPRAPTPVNGQVTPPQAKCSIAGAATPTSTVVNRSAAGMEMASGNASSRNGSISDSMNRSQGRMSTLGRSALLRTQRALSRMNSLSSASGMALAQDCNMSSNVDLNTTVGRSGANRQQMMIMSSLASNTTIGRAAAERALNFSASKLDITTGSSTQNGELKLMTSKGELDGVGEELTKEEEEKYTEDLQMVLLKLIVKRNPTILKYLLLFTFIGILFTSHLTFFFMHLEQICRQRGYDFSNVMGIITIAHSISEVFSFLVIVPYYIPLVGRTGSMLTIIAIFACRFAFYGTYFVEWSPWWSLVTETGHGFAYGMTYSLITEIATECVDQVDLYLPELIERGIVGAHMNAGELKLPLRATMYGLFSGAFDGLGNGIGALGSGIYLDSHSFVELWTFCTYFALFIGIVYPITEWRTFCRREKAQNI